MPDISVAIGEPIWKYKDDVFVKEAATKAEQFPEHPKERNDLVLRLLFISEFTNSIARERGATKELENDKKTIEGWLNVLLANRIDFSDQSVQDLRLKVLEGLIAQEQIEITAVQEIIAEKEGVLSMYGVPLDDVEGYGVSLGLKMLVRGTAFEELSQDFAQLLVSWPKEKPNHLAKIAEHQKRIDTINQLVASKCIWVGK